LPLECPRQTRYPILKRRVKPRLLLGRAIRYRNGKTSVRGSGRGTALLTCEDYALPSDDGRVSLLRPLLTCSHNAHTKHGAGPKCGMLQRLGGRLDRILVPQPATNIDVSYKTRPFLTRGKSGNGGTERARVRTQNRTQSFAATFFALIATIGLLAREIARLTSVECTEDRTQNRTQRFAAAGVFADDTPPPASHPRSCPKIIPTTETM
jgi:hypothetical protein